MARVTLTANEVKTNFGEVLMQSQREPVQISKYGKPVAVLVSASDYVSMDELKLELLKTRLEQAQIQQAKDELVDGRQFFDQLVKGKLD